MRNCKEFEYERFKAVMEKHLPRCLHLTPRLAFAEMPADSGGPGALTAGVQHLGQRQHRAEPGPCALPAPRARLPAPRAPPPGPAAHRRPKAPEKGLLLNR